MDAVTLDALRTLATAQGLQLTDEELARLLPLVQAGRALMQTLREATPSDVEPASQYRML
jgi:hypothetical protein